MEFKEQDYYPEEDESQEKKESSEKEQLTQESEAESQPTNETPQKAPTRTEKKVSIHFLISLVCIVAAISILLTFVITNNANRHYYSQELKRQQAIIDRFRENGGSIEEDGLPDFEQLEIMAQLFQQFSYYSDKLSEEELLNAVMKAYASATGDTYAEYYTEEEYAQITADREGDHVGIGVSVVQTTLDVEGIRNAVFQITAIYKNAPAESSELRVGDCIYAIKTESGYQNVSTLGYSKAMSLFGGEPGTTVEFLAFRPNENGYESLPFSIVRNKYESQSVSYTTAENDRSVGIVRITSFDLTTPHQLKEAVQTLQGQGVTKVVFDVRNNPGGDLQSIKASLTYFLQKGDLILSSIDRKGTVAKSYFAEAMYFTGEYAACNVSESEIGMFAELDMVVLCNGNTASAAEVFAATMRDYELATLVGETTFGKGIMQSFFPMSAFGDYKGYAKMTTYAYVTKCGVTYHEIGIAPHVNVPLSEEAKQYNFYVLPQAKDNQLQAAITQFQ